MPYDTDNKIGSSIPSSNNHFCDNLFLLHTWHEQYFKTIQILLRIFIVHHFLEGCLKGAFDRLLFLSFDSIVSYNYNLLVCEIS